MRAYLCQEILDFKGQMSRSAAGKISARSMDTYRSSLDSSSFSFSSFFSRSPLFRSGVELIPHPSSLSRASRLSRYVDMVTVPFFAKCLIDADISQLVLMLGSLHPPFSNTGSKVGGSTVSCSLDQPGICSPIKSNCLYIFLN